MRTLVRKTVSYNYIISQLDELGLEYHLAVDSWMNGYTYYCYVILCEFYGVPHTSEIIFNNLMSLLDCKFFKV